MTIVQTATFVVIGSERTVILPTLVAARGEVMKCCVEWNVQFAPYTYFGKAADELRLVSGLKAIWIRNDLNWRRSEFENGAIWLGEALTKYHPKAIVSFSNWLLNDLMQETLGKLNIGTYMGGLPDTILYCWQLRQPRAALYLASSN